MAAVREPTGGIVGAHKRLVSTSLRAERTRLELLAIELQEEKAWALRFLVIAVGALYLLSFGVLLAILALVVWAAEENRPGILAGFAAVFLIGGGVGVFYIMNAAKGRTPLFQDTVAVLKGDEEALRAGLRGSGD